MIMVGTMYSGEGDFEKCCEMVRKQDCECDHKVISGLPEVKAHETLYRTFKEGNYDYLIKLDADTVMSHDSVIKHMIKFLNTYRVERLSFWVKDFYTQEMMTGIHCYSNKVVWDWSQFVEGNLKPDRTDSSHQVGRARTERVVGGLHCYYATPKQSFHFGFHRVRKGQGARILQIARHYQQNYHENLRLAIIGGLVAAEESKIPYVGYANLDDLFDRNCNRAIDIDDVYSRFK